MGFPLDDWQFWATTVLFALAIAWLLRGFLPIPWLRARARRKKHERRATLTIEGHSVDRDPN